jgi:hypothetical protein
MVGRGIALNCARDLFTGEFVKPVAAAGAPPPQKPLGPLVLQGILIGPRGRAAVINGKVIEEGQTAPAEPGGPNIRARDIGVDSVVIETGGQSLRVEMAKPQAQDKPSTHTRVAGPARSTGRRQNGTMASTGSDGP